MESSKVTNYRFAGFLLDMGARRLLQGGKPVVLTPKEFQTLALLVEAEGRAVEREWMMRTIWPDTAVGDTSLGRNISILRRHLGANAIESVNRFGYRFGLPVTVCEPAPAQAAGETQNWAAGSPEPADGGQGLPMSLPEAAKKAGGLSFWYGASPWMAGGRLIALVAAASAVGFLGMRVAGRRVTASGASANATGPVRLAVLPFRNLSARAAETDYLRDGMADELTARLGELNLKHLQVLARSTTRQYVDTAKPTTVIANETGAQYLLEGSVGFDNDTARVRVGLVDAATQAVVWSKVLQQPIQDLPSVQEEIVNQIAANPLLAGAEGTPRRSEEPGVLPEAYDEYLRGRYEMGLHRREAYQRALPHFEQAVRLDPGYAKGHAAIAEAYIFMTDTLPLAFCYEKARVEVLAALRLDGTLSDAHRDLGYLQMYERDDAAGAEAEFRRALALNPDDPMTHHWYSGVLSDERRFTESVEQAHVGFELDPRSPRSMANYGYILVQAGDPVRGKQLLDAALQTDPGLEMAWGYLGLAYVRMGRFQDAASAYDHAASFESLSLSYQADAAFARAKGGDPTAARAFLTKLQERMERRQWFPAQAMAMTQLALGNKTEAREWLHKGVEDHSITLYGLNNEPIYSEIKDQPEFRSLLADSMPRP